jgi:hypothetical protein
MRLLPKAFRLCAVALLVAVSASGRGSVALPDMTQLRPCRLDFGGIVARSINRFSTPRIYEFSLDSSFKPGCPCACSPASTVERRVCKAKSKRCF